MAATDTQATTEQLLEAVFSVRSVPKIYKVYQLPSVSRDVRVEAGLNTSTVTLRVVGGDEKGSLESETVIGTWAREKLHWQAPAAYTKNKPILSSERAPHKNRP
jgi:hypothetical protein